MSKFDGKFWNLSQAAAWVVYRNRKLVEEFFEQSPDSWGGLILFPKMHGYKRVGNLDELKNALSRNDITAWGRRNVIDDELEAIPSSKCSQPL